MSACLASDKEKPQVEIAKSVHEKVGNEGRPQETTILIIHKTTF